VSHCALRCGKSGWYHGNLYALVPLRMRAILFSALLYINNQSLLMKQFNGK
jgi:hypothetical protein